MTDYRTLEWNYVLRPSKKLNRGSPRGNRREKQLTRCMRRAIRDFEAAAAYCARQIKAIHLNIEQKG